MAENVVPAGFIYVYRCSFCKYVTPLRTAVGLITVIGTFVFIFNQNCMWMKHSIAHAKHYKADKRNKTNKSKNTKLIKKTQRSL